MADFIHLSDTTVNFGTITKQQALSQTHKHTIYVTNTSDQGVYFESPNFVSLPAYQDGFGVQLLVSGYLTPGQVTTLVIAFLPGTLSGSSLVGSHSRTMAFRVLDGNTFSSPLLEVVAIDCSVAVEADTTGSPTDPTTSPVDTTAPPPTCTPTPTGCPDGYTEAPTCPDPDVPPDDTCTPPVVIPPPGPPTEKTVSAFVVDQDSIDLYGQRPGSGYQSDLIETVTQAKRVGEQIIWQSAQIIPCQVSIPHNPEIRKGKTIRVYSAREGIDVTGLVKTIGHSFDIKSGQATTQLVLLVPEYIFASQLGEELDLRSSL